MFRNGIALRRRWFLLFTLLAFALTLGAGGILWYLVETSALSEIRARVDAVKPIFTGIRLFLIALIAIVWPFATGSLHRWGQIDEVQATTILALRWRIITWLVVIELVLGQNLLGQVVAVLQGGRA
ncbi:MAG: hypothetical protein U9P00_06755 [Pseudomonadota bacterium]|nr:hypothetical protein [Pseudomonadota bacterium]